MRLAAWFYDGWHPLVETAAVGIAVYVSLVALLRVSGKRTLSKMNAFDFVVTVALGAILASTITSSSVSYSRGMVAFGVLVGLQFAVTFLSVRSEMVADLVKGRPALLYYKGRYYRDAMRRERVPESEILGAIRASGQGAPREVAAVLIETNGELTVMKDVDDDQIATLRPARGADRIDGDAA